MNEKGWVVDAPKMDSGQTSHKWKKAQCIKRMQHCVICVLEVHGMKVLWFKELYKHTGK